MKGRMHTIASPWDIFAPLAPLFAWLYATTSEDDEDGFGSADKGSDKNEDDGEVPSDWGSDNDDFEDPKDEDKSDKKDDKSKTKETKNSSAVIQKQKYRAKLAQVTKELELLKSERSDGGKVTEEEKKAKSAREWLRSEIQKLQEEDEDNIDQEAEALEDEVDEILDENEDLTKDQILDVLEEYDGISPSQAVKIIRKLEEASKGSRKEKPRVPRANEDGTRMRDEKDKKESKKPTSLDEIGRKLKERIKGGFL